MRVPLGLPRRFSIVVSLLAATIACPAFSLLGPYAKWMDKTNGYRWGNAVGGPMSIGQGYRWNVPIVTYAFDQSFLDFFGSNGVAAVEKSIDILNRLPRASSIVLTNFPFDSRGENDNAVGRGLYDLKSVSLVAVIEQLGLGAPSQNFYAIRRLNEYVLSYMLGNSGYDWRRLAPYYIRARNFDPETLAAT